MINFEDNDSNVDVIAFCDKEYWIMEWWPAYLSEINDKNIEDAYFNYIQKFRISLNDLILESKKMIEKENVSSLIDNLPCIYIDFDKKVFMSTFYEQQLEVRILAGWNGSYESFLDLIPQKYRYWVIDSINCADIV